MKHPKTIPNFMMGKTIQRERNTSKKVYLFIAGIGEVGHTLLDLLKDTTFPKINFQMLGKCDSQQVWWSEDAKSPDKALEWSHVGPTDWDVIIDKLISSSQENLIFVGATGSEEVARLYPALLKHNIHIVTPSKLANSFEQSFFDELQSYSNNKNKNNVSFRYEATVGAGLPVISTITNLQSSGDEIHEISGVFSGTMTYLFNELEKGVPFSKAVKEAREQGYAEPDPRDDLSGEDVARKLLTLARTLGWRLEREQLNVESLVPIDLAEVSKNTFLKRLRIYDDQWADQMKVARQQNKTLRYTGKFSEGDIHIGVEAIDKKSPLGQLQGTDNLVQIFSDYYRQTPIVIQGPGAGKEVTAAGVLADVIKTSQEMI